MEYTQICSQATWTVLAVLTISALLMTINNGTPLNFGAPDTKSKCISILTSNIFVVHGKQMVVVILKA